LNFFFGDKNIYFFYRIKKKKNKEGYKTQAQCTTTILRFPPRRIMHKQQRRLDDNARAKLNSQIKAKKIVVLKTGPLHVCFKF